MIRKRNIGTMAALGGLTAAIALLTGLPSASADELADLRANQELLQRRVDQLAQAGPSSGPGPGGRVRSGSFPRSSTTMPASPTATSHACARATPPWAGS